MLDLSSDKITNTAYQTSKGKMILEKIEDFLISDEAKELKGQVNLIFTSPPFPLIRKKNMVIEQETIT